MAWTFKAQLRLNTTSQDYRHVAPLGPNPTSRGQRENSWEAALFTAYMFHFDQQHVFYGNVILCPSVWERRLPVRLKHCQTSYVFFFPPFFKNNDVLCEIHFTPHLSDILTQQLIYRFSSATCPGTNHVSPDLLTSVDIHC